MTVSQGVAWMVSWNLSLVPLRISHGRKNVLESGELLECTNQRSLGSERTWVGNLGARDS
jgi:hypothetical protein